MSSESNPLVSVVMPAYNTENTIVTAIESILEQSYTNLELVIINDGSEDSTLEKIQSINDPRITLITIEKNAGIVASLNAGLSSARGEYIARMDADDFSRKTRLASQVEFLNSNAGVGVCGTAYQKFTERIGDGPAVQHPTDHQEIMDNFLLGRCVISHPTAMIRGELLNSEIKYQESFTYCEDFYLWFKLSKVTRFANLKEVLLDYRISSGAISIKNRDIQSRLTKEIQKRFIFSPFVTQGLTEQNPLIVPNLVRSNRRAPVFTPRLFESILFRNSRLFSVTQATLGMLYLSAVKLTQKVRNLIAG